MDVGTHCKQAELLDDQGRWAWRLWRAEIVVPPGAHEIVVRAWDTAANTQPERPETVWSPQGYVTSSWGHIEVHAST